MEHLHIPDVPWSVSVISGGVHPFAEARERASLKTERQPAIVSGVTVDVTISVDAVANNWQRIIRRLEREIDTPYPNQTFYLQRIIAPCPAYDGWTVCLQFDSLEDMERNLERFRQR